MPGFSRHFSDIIAICCILCSAKSNKYYNYGGIVDSFFQRISGFKLYNKHNEAEYDNKT